MAASLEAFFERLARRPGYEPRSGQIQMAQAIDEALTLKRHLFVEAGTGTGKTYAYLLPALRHKVRTVVSTSTKALQEQLCYKDLPELSSLLGDLVDVRFALLKGRKNYVCLHQLEILKDETRPVFETSQQSQQFKVLLKWLERDQTGDLELFPGVLDSDLEELVTIDSHGCLGWQCSFYQKCFLMQARAEAEKADIVVVNHALLVNDLLLRSTSKGVINLLGEVDFVVIDEAHRLEEATLGVLGLSLSPLQLERFRRKLLRQPGLGFSTRGVLDRLGVEVALFKEKFLSQASLEDFVEQLRKIDTTLADLKESLRKDARELPTDQLRLHFELLLRHLEQLYERTIRIHLAIENPDPNRVTYVDKTRQALLSYPLDVGEALDKLLFSRFPTVVCTSATLAVPTSTHGDPFTYVRRRLGAFSAEGIQIESTFDYFRQMLLYLPSRSELLDPSEADLDLNKRSLYEQTLIEEIRQLILAAGGRALVLTTSYRMMNLLADALGECGYPVLKQGMAPRRQLLDALRSQPSVLVATRSFWEGVDVQGDAISLVIIDRLPFPIKDDIFWQARYRRAGALWFDEEALPHALLTLKQGFGRLIRSKTDYGVVALLDGRIQTRSYGKLVLEALPSVPVTSSIEEVKEFFAGRSKVLPRSPRVRTRLGVEV